jgi:glutamine synthetase
MLYHSVRKCKTCICEYIWIGKSMFNEEFRPDFRSKTKIISTSDYKWTIPDWDYDASSTNQASSNGDTEGILNPVAIYKNPLRKIDGCESILVLCETYDSNGNPFKSNTRYNAVNIFNSKTEEYPWFGLEQEYFIFKSKEDEKTLENPTTHYCGSATCLERQIAEKHLQLCLEAGLKISGINAEVANNQWEFQVGPCEGIKAADQLVIARYLLERLAEEFGVIISYEPKPSYHANGSGCHTNFSTELMRSIGGVQEIYKAINKLQQKHDEHISVYGKDNNFRLTGEHETASFREFSYGVGTRNTSVRIPNHVEKNGCGYFEDRRPAANMDPYVVTSKIFETCCL